MSSLITLITPTNLDAEREKFFASAIYDPAFHYTWQDQDIAPIVKVSTKLALWRAIHAQDHDEIVRQAQKHFAVEIDDQVLASARKTAQTKGEISHGTAREYADQLHAALDYFDIHDLQIVITQESGFNARPNHKDKLITISQHIHFDYFSMEGGVHHELVHILRYRNGQYNQIKRSNNYLPTEEGLASWCQDNANNDNGVAQHALEYVASSVGLKGSLRDVFDCLTGLGMSPDLAWKRASRHKFGFVDTSKPGDILKPAMYYANEIKVDKLTTAEKLCLFVGKISLDELTDYPSYTGLWPAEKIISYFKL